MRMFSASKNYPYVWIFHCAFTDVSLHHVHDRGPADTKERALRKLQKAVMQTRTMHLISDMVQAHLSTVITTPYSRRIIVA